MCAMTQDERETMLQNLRRLATAAEGGEQPIEKVFLPLARHGLALREQVLVIRGERGTGKTALFHFLTRVKDQPDVLASIFPECGLQGISWVEGFSEGSGHPQTQVLDRLGADADDVTLRTFWMAHLACCLRSEKICPASFPEALWQLWQSKLNEPGAWIRLAQVELGPLTQWVDSVERELAGGFGKTVIVTYDHLDKIGLYDRGVRNRFTAGLLALWLSLSNRYRHLRAKIFVREDLFEAAQQASADASKLRARSVVLEWDTESLYRMLIRHMGALATEVRDWIGRGQNSIPLKEHPHLDWMPPETLPEQGRPSQKAFADHLAGEQMGKGIKKGYTYRWIPNRLQDAHGRIVPRSMLALVGSAAEVACQKGPRARGDRLLHPGELQAALEDTSRTRARELEEEHKVVSRLENLREQVVPLMPRELRRSLSRPISGPVAPEDGLGQDGEAVMAELLRLGVLKERPGGSIDVPDIYRYGFSIKRKGGVARPH